MWQAPDFVVHQAVKDSDEGVIDNRESATVYNLK